VDKGVLTIRHDCLYLRDMILRRFQISHALIDGFRVRGGWTTFVFTSHLGQEALWNGVHSLPNALGILRSGLDHEVLMPAGWSTLEIDVANHLIDSEGLLPKPVFTGAMAPQKGQLRLTAPAAAAARRKLAALLDHAGPQTHFVLTEDPAVGLRREILDLLAHATGLGCEDAMCRPESSAFQKRRLVRKARAMLEQQLHDSPRIDTIALELGVTVRSLQRSFLTVLGVSPKQYLLARKLDAARRAMRRRRHAGGVFDVAHEFGFVSPSRFAEQFRRHFGHTPSALTRLAANLGS